MKRRYESLREFKQANRYTAEQMAEALGGVISTSYLRLLLSGFRSPGKALARQLSEKTGVPVEKLLYPPLKRSA